MKYNILRRLPAAWVPGAGGAGHGHGRGGLLAQAGRHFPLQRPGRPGRAGYAVQAVQDLMEKGVPIFGICLGHQILGQAFGGKTFKLKFGHRGANQPVKDLESGRVEITAQNHGFAVDPATLPSDVVVDRINLNDQTVEGMRHKKRPVFCVQYHPEASPGRTTRPAWFARFRAMIEKN